MFAIGTAIGAVVLTIVCARSVGFSLNEIVTNFTRKNSVVEGLLNPDWGQIWSRRSRSAFVETLQLAVLGTATGATAALPLALWSTTFGNPNRWLRLIVRSFNNVIRSIPDLLWALLFVTAVGIGALSGLLALFFFSLAVTTKLTSDTLDGIDMGPIEAANAAGANLNQMLRTAVVPQILPSYTSLRALQLRAQLARLGCARPCRCGRHRPRASNSSVVVVTGRSCGASSSCSSSSCLSSNASRSRCAGGSSDDGVEVARQLDADTARGC